MINNFCVFILTHGRAHKVFTYLSLLESNYTGPVYLVIDNEDTEADEYYRIYGDKVVMFDKNKVAEKMDQGDNFKDKRTIVYARNACFEIARNLGYEYFIQLDDDYFNFCYKIDENYQYLDSTNKSKILDLDSIFGMMLDYYKNIPARSLAMSQGGDYIGGRDSQIHKSINSRRKAMNTLICSVNREFKYFGRINEDVNAYSRFQNLGNLFLTIPLVAIQQKQTQSNSGGMTEMYLDSGTYVKSFYTVMYQPSSVKISMMGESHRRLYHFIEWAFTVPCIISEDHKKQ